MKLKNIRVMFIMLFLLITIGGMIYLKQNLFQDIRAVIIFASMSALLVYGIYQNVIDMLINKITAYNLLDGFLSIVLIIIFIYSFIVDDFKFKAYLFITLLQYLLYFTIKNKK